MRMQMIQLAEYKENFFFDIMSRVIGFVIFWFTWQSVLGNTDIPGWDLKGLLVLAGFQNLITSIMLMTIYGVGHIRREIVRGNLDNFLCRPTVPWFIISIQNGYFAIAGFIIGFVLLGLAWSTGGLILDTGIALAIFILFFLGVGIAYCFSLCLASITFWIGKNDLFEHLFWGIYEFDAYPTNIFPGAIQLLLSFTVPFMLLITLPTLLVLDRIPFSSVETWIGVSCIALIGMALLANACWKAGVKRYEAFG